MDILKKNSKNKKALITGITGQDGSYLAEFLLEKGYEVHGIKRRSSSFNTSRIDHLYQDPHENKTNFFLHYGDLTDSTSLVRIIQDIKPDEIYNLAAQSHVKVSFDIPEYTANSTALGTLRILESLKSLNLKKTKYYQASSSEMFGKQKSKKSKAKSNIESTEILLADINIKDSVNHSDSNLGNISNRKQNTLFCCITVTSPAQNLD